MDSQLGNDHLNQIFEENIISLSGCDSDTELIELEEDLNKTRPYSIIDRLMGGPPICYTNHQTPTIPSPAAISHPLATMATTITTSNASTTPSTSISTTSHDNMQQKTTSAHTRFTVLPSKTISKPTTTLSDCSSLPSKHIPFNFHLIPRCPSYITDLNLPTKLAKICRDIHLNAELFIIKVVEDHLKTQAKIKKTNKNKNKKAVTYKLKFTSKENKLTPPSPISYPTDNTTVIQNTPPISEQLTFTTTTHYNQPFHNTLTSTYTKLHPLLECTTPIHYQPNTNHITQTHTSTFKELPFTQVQIDNIYHSFYNTSTLPNTTPSNKQNPYNHYISNHIHRSSQTLPCTPSI